MKKVLFLLLFITTLCIPYIPKADAMWIIQTHPSLDYAFSSPVLYQGDNAHINVTITSNYDKEIVINRIGLQFDWMSATEWIEKELSSEPVALNRSDTASFGKFEFQVPSTVKTGNHNLTLLIYYDEFENTTWTVPVGAQIIGEPPNTVTVTVDYASPLPLYKLHTVEIHSIKEKQYYELKTIALQQLSKAIEKSYLSSGARDVLQQATSEYNDATALAIQDKWLEAYEALQLTQSLLNRVPTEENNFIMLIAGGGIGGVVVIGIVIYVLRRKSPKH